MFPGATVYFWHCGKTVVQGAYGCLSQGGYLTDQIEVKRDTIYDIASLTKIVACVPVIASLCKSDRLRLDQPICEYLPEFGFEGDRARVTVRHLLTHTGGLPAHVQLYRQEKTRESLMKAALAQQLVFEPGRAWLYSDVGYIVLTALAERVSGLRFDECAYSLFIQPIGMSSTTFQPRATLRPRIAPTEYSETRGGLIQGFVHDENSSVMDGVSGHAGLFSTILDLARFCETILEFGQRLPVAESWPELIATMIYGRASASSITGIGLGWRRNAPKFMGDLAGDDVFGHTGFTGTMILLSHRREFALVVLSNRVCPSRNGPDINEFRRSLCGVLAAYLSGRRIA